MSEVAEENAVDLATWRELTEKAAYMQGITLVWPSEPDMKPRDAKTRETYAPIDDDAQAFRLASQLIMHIEHLKNHKHVYNRVHVGVHGFGHVGSEVTYRYDRNKAMRLAIVHAAAAMYDEQQR
jgi:hypothetical protein